MLNLSLYKTILGALIALLIVTTIWAILGARKVAPKQPSGQSRIPEDDPILYLQELYAKGEINKEEYEARKKHFAA
jgi:uncharacterized membrane protein